MPSFAVFIKTAYVLKRVSAHLTIKKVAISSKMTTIMSIRLINNETIVYFGMKKLTSYPFVHLVATHSMRAVSMLEISAYFFTQTLCTLPVFFLNLHCSVPTYFLCRLSLATIVNAH